MGHATDKVELLILGGTWSAYSRKYREWFVRRCLDAMNEANPSENDVGSILSGTKPPSSSGGGVQSNLRLHLSAQPQVQVRMRHRQ